MFERFTDRARRVLVLAQEQARQLDHGFIGTEHILLGLIQEDEGVAADALRQLHVSQAPVREKVLETIAPPVRGGPSGSPPFTPRAKKVLELALREAIQLGHSYIGTEHILLGLVREGEGVAAQVLVSLGVDLARVRQEVIKILSGYQEQQGASPGARAFTAHGPGRRPGGTLAACSFCGRRAPESGRLVSGTDAFICEHCVRRWATQLERPPDWVARSGLAPEPVATTGPPPGDQDAARAEIATAFAAIFAPSDDGSAVPAVEDGANLGPTVDVARRRRPEWAAGSLTVTADDVVFIDAEHAAVWFSVTTDGNPLLARSRGDALVVGGTWKVARRTFCGLMGMVGVHCPPE